MSIVESFRQTISFFDEIKKEGLINDYALRGGLALSAWVRPRTTQDIDFVVALSGKITWRGIVSVIENRLHKRVAVHKGTKSTNIKDKLSFIAGSMEVDAISTKGFLLAAEAMKHAVVAKIFGMDVRVVTPEYLILLKLLPLGEQDVLDIKARLKKTDKTMLFSLAEKNHLLIKLESVVLKNKRLPPEMR